MGLTAMGLTLTWARTGIQAAEAHPLLESPATLAEPGLALLCGAIQREGGGQPSTWAEKLFFPAASSSDSLSDPVENSTDDMGGGGRVREGAVQVQMQDGGGDCVGEGAGFPREAIQGTDEQPQPTPLHSAPPRRRVPPHRPSPAKDSGGE